MVLHLLVYTDLPTNTFPPFGLLAITESTSYLNALGNLESGQKLVFPEIAKSTTRQFYNFEQTL